MECLPLSVSQPVNWSVWMSWIRMGGGFVRQKGGHPTDPEYSAVICSQGDLISFSVSLLRFEEGELHLIDWVYMFLPASQDRN